MGSPPEETLEAVRGVVADVLEKGGGTWAACADAGLLGLAVPEDLDGEDLGGEGLGFAGVAAILTEVGQRAADLPVWETLVCGLLPLLSTDEHDLVAAVIAGDLLLSPAFDEPGDVDPAAPATTFDGTGLSGTKVGVALHDGARLLVTATYDGRTVVALVDDPPAPTPGEDSAGRAVGAYRFDATPARVLGDPDPAAYALLTRRLAAAGLLVLGAGLLAGARDLTAGYVKGREQFGRSLAEFQAVAMQVADVYVAARTVDLAARSVVREADAGWRTDDDLAVAAYWFCDRAPAALQTCQHLHGGMGVDVTYALPGYFARVRDVARRLGGAAHTLAAVPVEETGKNLELSEEQRAFKAEVRAYFEALVPRDDRVELMHDRHGPAYHRTIKHMGSDGWMGVGWPVEHGGRGLGAIEQQSFANEAARNDVHLPSVTLQTVGPTLQAFGTQAQKERFLKPILTGDVHFAIGYSEPDAGTDLAALRTTARREGDHYVVNGQKLWTTGGHAADFVWLAVRTDPDAPKHQGISVLIVDTTDPGYSWTPIITSDGSHHVNATYYNDVRVPVDMLVGEENQGWRLITTQLNHERVMLGPAGRLEGLRDAVRTWAEGRTTPAGDPLLDQPDLRDALARTTAAFRVNELLNWEVAEAEASGPVTVADASASKVFASDEVQRLGLALTEAVERYADPTDPDSAYLLTWLDRTVKRNLVLTFGGGVNEVQRELICMFGLGLPRVPR